MPECDHEWEETGRSPWVIYYRCRLCPATKTEPNPLVLDDEALPPRGGVGKDEYSCKM